MNEGPFVQGAVLSDRRTEAHREVEVELADHRREEHEYPGAWAVCHEGAEHAGRQHVGQDAWGDTRAVSAETAAEQEV